MKKELIDFEWNRILHGDVLDKIKEIPNDSIDCLVTSPPYYGLRDYGIEGQIWDGNIDCEHKWGDNIISVGSRSSDPGDKKHLVKGDRENFQKSNYCINCNAWKGSLGLEPTFHMFIDHLVQIFEALKPKLCDHGSIWINLGDTYYGGGNAQGHTGLTTNLGKSTLQRDGNQNPVARGNLLPRKTLIGIPDRFKIAMIDSGWICRNDIIWFKRSTMPSSAKDRFTVDYERFLFFTKKPKYYFKQQFEPIKEDSLTRYERGNSDNSKWLELENNSSFKANTINKPREKREREAIETSKLGRNKRTVWDINPASFKEAHFAVFPERLIETPIDASCPKLVCTKCSKPEQIIEVKIDEFEDEYEKKLIVCNCNAEFRKGRVLDPFMGAGTTALVAHKQNKDWLGIELKEEYIKIAERRLLNNTDILLQQHFDFE